MKKRFELLLDAELRTQLTAHQKNGQPSAGALVRAAILHYLACSQAREHLPRRERRRNAILS